MLYLRSWSRDAEGARYQPGIPGGVIDLGALALVMSDRALTDVGAVNLGESVESISIETRRTVARASGLLDEKALDAGPTLKHALFDLFTTKRPAGMKCLMPTRKRVVNLWVGNRIIMQKPVKPDANDPLWIEIQKNYWEQYRATPLTMRPKRLGYWLKQWPECTEKDFIPPDLPLIKAAKPSTTYTDDFTYADGNLNGKGNWLKGFDQDCVVGTNQVRVYTGGTGSTDYYNVAFSAADMETWINVTTHNDVPAGKNSTGRLYNRLQGATTNGYGFESGKRNPAGPDNFRQISRFTASSPTSLSLITGVSLSIPYELRGRSDGSDHTIFVGGAEYETVSDATYSNLYAGIGGFDSTGVTGYLWMDNWGATDELVAGSPWYYYAQQ